MNFKSLFASLAIAFGAVTSAHATLFTLDSYSITANQGYGLEIETKKLLDTPYSFELDHVGDMHIVNLFKIWTNETWVNYDDTVEQPISVSFDFSAPLPGFGGVENGTTDGVNYFFGKHQYGEVDWGAPLYLAFGAHGDGILRVSLEDETFNYGGFWKGLTEGKHDGEKVKVKFKLIKKPKEPPVTVSEPGALGLIGLGLVGLGVAARRRRG